MSMIASVRGMLYYTVPISHNGGIPAAGCYYFM